MSAPAISMVESATSTECRDGDPAAILAAVRNGKWRQAVEQIRLEYQRAVAEGRDAKEAVAPLKRRLPGILWSGRFARRSKEALLKHSGYLCADIDNVPAGRLATLRTELGDDPHVVACFASPTGTGLKVVFSVCAEESLHAASFWTVQRRLQERYGVAADEAAKDVSRICFVSWDPEMTGAVSPRPLPPDEPPSDLPAAESLPRPSPAPSAGRAGRLPAGAEDLLAHGAQKGRRNDRALWLACQLRDSGWDQASAEQDLRAFAARCTPPLPEPEALGAVRSAYSRPPRPPAGAGKRPTPGSPAAEYLGEDEAGPLLEFPEPDPWPEPLHPAAFHGLAGDLVRTIEPHSEADPAALLTMFLAAFGNASGSGAHFMVEARAHAMRIWTVLVGETAKGRKGSAWSSLRHVLQEIDPSWVNDRVQSGLSTGEGAIWAVRDAVVREKQGEVVVEDSGVADKRLFSIEEEFSAVLRVAERNGNTITDVLRRAWDHGDLRSLTKNSPARATGAHLTIVGHITTGELSKLLSETHAINGFGNRFLWAAVRRSKHLPDGGQLHKQNLSALVLAVQRALDFARKATLVERTPAAAELWQEVYPVLTADCPGLLGALTNRAEAYVLRIALIFAMLDESPAVDVVHLRAALAVWEYCERSAAFIFGDSLGDRITDRLRDELRLAGRQGLTQTAIRDLFSRNESNARLARALAALERAGLAIRVRERDKPGRPACKWYYAYDQNDKNAKNLPTGTHGKHLRPLRSFLA